LPAVLSAKALLQKIANSDESLIFRPVHVAPLLGVSR
jgi:hypothetical protein